MLYRVSQLNAKNLYIMSYTASLKIKALNFCSENTGLTSCGAGQAYSLRAVCLLLALSAAAELLCESLLLFQTV